MPDIASGPLTLIENADASLVSVITLEFAFETPIAPLYEIAGDLAFNDLNKIKHSCPLPFLRVCYTCARRYAEIY